MKKRFALLLLTLIAAKPPITARIVTADERKACTYLGLVTASSQWSMNNTGGSLKNALRKVQKMGGNGLFIVTQHSDALDGGSVNGEALRCPS